MKQLANVFIFYILSFLYAETAISAPFELKINSTWQPLSSDSEKKKTSKESYIHVGTIVLRKKTPKQMKIKRIILKWNPQRSGRLNAKYFELDNLAASLYKPRYKQKILPTDEFVICDGSWDKKRQCLIFEFDEEFTLDPVNEFCLVLNIPETIKPKLHNSSFKLDERALPFKVQKDSTNKYIKIYYDI
jgi:hypothetical protein